MSVALNGECTDLVGLKADFGHVPAIQLKRLVVACDRDRMALAVDSDELERNVVVLVDNNLAWRKQINHDFRTASLIRLIQ